MVFILDSRVSGLGWCWRREDQEQCSHGRGKSQRGSHAVAIAPAPVRVVGHIAEQRVAQQRAPHCVVRTLQNLYKPLHQLCKIAN